jgi:hypothetical protein
MLTKAAPVWGASSVSPSHPRSRQVTRPLSRGHPCTTTLKGAPAHPETEDIRDMMVTDITLAAFTFCNSARVVAYVAQIQGGR